MSSSLCTVKADYLFSHLSCNRLSPPFPFLNQPASSLAPKAFFSTTHDKTYLIINSLGIDRTGIVSDLSKLVTDAGGNVGESQAAKVGNHFSLTMLISVPTEKKDSLQASLESLSGMTTHCIESESDPTATQIKPSIAYSGRFVLEGADDPGLVHKVTTILAKHNLSIDTMETSDEIAPYGGTTLFRIDGIATALNPLPKSFDPDGIRDELADLGNNLNCDITLDDNVTRKSRGSWIWENAA